jgi:hypothetical protein
MALKQFENEFDFPEKVTPYFLDLIAFREISNDIAVLGATPIATIDFNQKYNVSHSDIDAES